MYLSTPNSCLFILYPCSFCGAVVQRGSAVLNYPELILIVNVHFKFTNTCTLFLVSNSGSKALELPWTHVCSPYSPSPLCGTVVQRGSVGLSYPELMLNFRHTLLPVSNSGLIRFGSFELFWPHVSSPYSPISFCGAGNLAWVRHSSKRFGRIELCQTRSKFLDKTFPVSNWFDQHWNYLKLMFVLLIVYVPCVVQWFKELRYGGTIPNSC